MAADRDLCVAFARAWGNGTPPIRSGWEMTAATGVRGLRLLDESGVFSTFTFTETDPEALWVLAENARGRPGARVHPGDARSGTPDGPFDYVDLDPYGTPEPFVAAALAAVRPGGVVAVSATDMMVLAGVQAGACERRYGARPIRGRLGPEGGLRILLAYLAREARARQRLVRPLLSYVRDHHVRTYLDVRTTGTAPDPVGPIDPRTWAGPDVGAQGPYGPFWLGPLFDPELVRRLAVPAAAARPTEVSRFIERLVEEVAADVPFYFEANVLASALGLPRPAPVVALRDALRQQGYRAARTHARPEGLRTDAPRSVVENVARSVARSPQSQNARVRA